MHDQVVLITGASGSLGSVVARRFAESGALLVLSGRDGLALERLSASLPAPESRIVRCTADLSDPAQASAPVNTALRAFGHVDCLLHLVGGWQGGTPLATLTDEQWDAMLTVNLHSAFHICRAVLPAMLARGQGRIVLVGSRAVERPGAGQAPYNVAKAGVMALARSIAADYGAQGIRANVILPGTIDTPANRQAMPRADRRGWVSPHALAEVMLLLCGPAGDEINDAAIPVYGA